MAILLEAIYRFNVISMKLPMIFFTKLEQQQKNCPKIYTEPVRSCIVKVILGEKNQAVGITPPDFRQYYKVTVIKTA